MTHEAALPASTSVNLKRRHEAPSFDDVDSENIDPSNFCSPSKKNKTGLQDSFQPPKAAHFVLNASASTTTKQSLGRQIRSTHRSDATSVGWQGLKLGETPKTPLHSVTPPTPRLIDSAPAAAGRSPKSKRIGILSRRRMTASPFTRVNPPSFASNGVGGGLPFSIDAALSGTVPSYKPAPVQAKEVQHKEFPTLEESVPQGWMFDIYEETEEMQEQNVVVHRACNLDISDDESNAGVKADRGKENIPPGEGLFTGPAEITTVMPASRKNMMTDEARTPLGDLEASDFYAEGCDASSYIMIPGEGNPTEQVEDKQINDAEPKLEHLLTQPHAHEFADGWKGLPGQVESSKQYDSSGLSHSPFQGQVELDTPPTVEIWESESAKDEDEKQGLDQAAPNVA